ncbi:hypothetical protein PUNSTDRAFT_131025 [Punctularia strigosozonata HHB-11173 SS5]|uniref:uncharacterized protein n=1 Tax=Punctularia strigosozonata (strain HHB-11173) TaxID=741275 RepID=UPI0004418281|nr:uncharacterized protein PUNSTDRAFT_131025 [Punctularia strigosozonata HHB-11173 SS5]EIN12785.1 hypothetical protein PUNSTDRAFT_131025 [Punctularia strigosozonata HHB-11173 SS5]
MNKLPDELLALIAKHASEYPSPNWDPFHDSVAAGGDDFYSERKVTAFTRWSLCLINRKWHAIAKPYLYRDIRIRHCYWLPLPARLSSLLTASDRNPKLLVGTHTLDVRDLPSAGIHLSKTAAVRLCHLLSQVTLKHFATNFYPGYVPWLSLLAHTSARTLTYLDIQFNPRRVPIDSVETINSFVNLVYLRITDRLDDDTPAEPRSPASLDELPALALPKLEVLDIISGLHWKPIHPGGAISFSLASRAHLPSLRKLRLHGDPNRSRTDIRSIIGQHGPRLQELFVHAPYSDDDLDDILLIAPELTELTCIVPEGNYMRPHASKDAIVLQHPKLQRLTVTGGRKGLLAETYQCMDTGKFLELQYIKLDGISWDSEDIEVARSGKETCSIEEDLDVAIKLAAEGIPLLDQRGKPFGGLVATRRRWMDRASRVLQ